MVAIKIGALLLFFAVAFTGFRAANYAPFPPHGARHQRRGGAIFFAYIGFDALHAGEEAQNPSATCPSRSSARSRSARALLPGRRAVAVGGSAGGRSSRAQRGRADRPIMKDLTGERQDAWAVLLAAGAVVAIASVVLTVLYGQTRILFAMSRDGLVPKVFSTVQPPGPECQTAPTP